jgi:heptosyltransferase-3
MRQATQVPRNILIVCTQRIGDVLLSTPIARSIKRHWPQANIDYLVLPGTDGALEGNPDIRKVHVFAQRVGLREKISQFQTIWRQYDLAIAAAPTDRARLFARAAAKRTIGFTTPDESGWLKRRLLNISIPFDNLNTHTVSMCLKLVEPLNIGIEPVVQPPDIPEAEWTRVKQQLGIGQAPYVVIHPYPKFRYKMWTQQNWATLINWLGSQSLQVFLTGSKAPDELAYIDEIIQAAGHSCQSLGGQLTLAQTTHLLKEALLYIGPDTAVTHLAVATGTPSIALFGPSNPVKWGPWPIQWRKTQSPWLRIGSQKIGHISLLQGQGTCVPCLHEGCDRHINSESRCLTELAPEVVIAQATKLLSPQGMRTPEP